MRPSTPASAARRAMMRRSERSAMRSFPTTAPRRTRRNIGPTRWPAVSSQTCTRRTVGEPMNCTAPAPFWSVFEYRGVHEPEVGLRGGVALLGSEADPPHRLGVVLGHTLAVGVHDPEVELRGGVTLLGVVLESSKGGGIVASLICLYSAPSSGLSPAAEPEMTTAHQRIRHNNSMTLRGLKAGDQPPRF